MAMSNFPLVLLCLTWLVSALNAEVVKFAACEDNPGKCQINELRADPCREAANNKPCVVKRGNNATISFDFTPEWSAEKLFGHVYAVTDEGDAPMPRMNTDGCLFTTCPVQASTKHTYTYALPLDKKFPKGTYTIRWILRNEAKPDTTTERCCFTTKVKLIK